MVLTERRNVAVRTTLMRRIRSEFEEMPGMSLTLGQAAALFGVSREAGSRILLGLTEERVLRLSTPFEKFVHVFWAYAAFSGRDD
jgi:hypothetical protein